MSNFIPASTFYDAQSLRKKARRAGMDAGQAMADFRKAGYSRAFLNEFSERALRTRVPANAPSGDAA